MWIVRRIADLLSPPFCAACDAEIVHSHAAFCRACASTVELEQAPFTLSGHTVLALGSFGGALATAIRRLKYEDCPDLARPLGDLLGHACRRARLPVDVVVPVPLHIERLTSRGYNQAALIASRIARVLHVRLCTRALVRTGATVAQAQLARSERKRNVAGAFELSDPRAVRGRRVLLVDDVTTTGATLLACFSLLADAGSGNLTGSVVARTRSESYSAPKSSTDALRCSTHE